MQLNFDVTKVDQWGMQQVVKNRVDDGLSSFLRSKTKRDKKNKGAG